MCGPDEHPVRYLQRPGLRIGQPGIAYRALVSKVRNIRMAMIATEIIMAHYESKEYPISNLSQKIPHFGVKEAASVQHVPGCDPVLGPEMRSTGEVLGIADSFGLAYFKAQEATQLPLVLRRF